MDNFPSFFVHSPQMVCSTGQVFLHQLLGADMEEKRSQDELIDIHRQYNDIVNMDAWNVYSKVIPSYTP